MRERKGRERKKDEMFYETFVDPAIVSFITYERTIVTLYANSTAGALYKNKFESWESPTRTGTVIVNCSVCCRSNDDRTRSL